MLRFGNENEIRAGGKRIEAVRRPTGGLPRFFGTHRRGLPPGGPRRRGTGFIANDEQTAAGVPSGGTVPAAAWSGTRVGVREPVVSEGGSHEFLQEAGSSHEANHGVEERVHSKGRPVLGD